MQWIVIKHSVHCTSMLFCLGLLLRVEGKIEIDDVFYADVILLR